MTTHDPLKLARDALKPCPFCGSTNLSTDDASDFIACLDCGTEGPVGVGLGGTHNAEAWNRRAAIDALPASVQAVTADDYFTLLGHAVGLRGDGLTDMPAYFFDLAARIAPDAEHAARARSIAASPQAAIAPASVPSMPDDAGAPQVTESWCAQFPGTAAAMINEAAERDYQRLTAQAAIAPASVPSGQPAVRCELVESCRKCRHAVGRQSCALARRDIEGAGIPDWCPLPVYRATAPSAPAPAAVPVRPMTADRAVYFMERFKREEKLLGPNEQAALDFVIAMLDGAPAVAAPEPRKPDGRLHQDGYFTWAPHHAGYKQDRRLPCDFYLAAPTTQEPQ